jgi:MFS transporter, SET family, sugar efflux transporter
MSSEQASSELGRLRRAALVLFGQSQLRMLLICSVLLGLSSSFVMPYMSMFGTLEVGMSLPAFGAFMTATTLGNVVIASMLARWSDRLPSRRVVLLLGASAGVLGYVGYAFVRNPWMLLAVGMLLLGVASLTFSQLFAHARECIARLQMPAEEAPLYMNGFRMAFAGAWTLGPALAAVALAQVGFRGLFLSAAGFQLTFLVLVRLFVPATPVRPSMVPQPASVTLDAASPLDGEGASRPEPPRLRAPSLWSSLKAQPGLLGWFAAFVLLFAAQAISMSNMSLYVLHELGGSERDLGLIFGIAPIFELPSMVYLGLLATRVESGQLIRASMALSALYFGCLSLVTAPWQIYPLQILSAIVVSITSGIAITFFQDQFPGKFGAATNFYLSATRIGATSGYLMFGTLASRFSHRGAYVGCLLLALTALVGASVMVGHRSQSSGA